MSDHIPFFSPGDAPDAVYRFNRDEPTRAALRETIESMWTRFRPYCAERPSQFIREARSEFYVRTWEMYLGCALLDHGIKLHRAPPAGPDLCFDLEGTRGWVEAILATPGTSDQNAKVIWSTIRNGVQFAYPRHEPRILRYTNAVKIKIEKYRKDLRAGRVAPSEPYIIGISAASIELAESDDGVPDFIKAVMGIGDAAFRIPIGGGGRPQRVFPARTLIKKVNRDLEPSDLFYDEEYAPVSGLFFTPWNIINLPTYPADGIAFFHNPFASAPVPRGTFKFGREYWLNKETSCLEWTDWTRSAALKPG